MKINIKKRIRQYKENEQFDHKQQERAGVSKMKTKLVHEPFHTKEQRMSKTDNRLLFVCEKIQMHFFLLLLLFLYVNNNVKKYNNN